MTSATGKYPFRLSIDPQKEISRDATQTVSAANADNQGSEFHTIS